MALLKETDLPHFYLKGLRKWGSLHHEAVKRYMKKRTRKGKEGTGRMKRKMKKRRIYSS